jgi:ATP-dependent helicase/nuclease subunit A
MSVLPDHRDAFAGQASAAEPGANAWVAANAGSGKTKVLIDRVARLLLKGAEPDSILCVTYTKAAASEMQDRLFERLGKWCVASPVDLQKDLAELEGRNDFSLGELDRARELFARALETPGGLRIETIHAFCGRVLRRFPIEAGIAPGFHELDEKASDEIWEAAFRNLGARVSRGSPDLVAAAHIVAEAGGAGLGVLRALHEKRGAIEGLLSGPGGIRAGVARIKKALGAPDESVEEILERAMGTDLPRDELARLCSALPSDKKSDAEACRTLAFVLSDADTHDRFEAYCSMAFTGGGERRKSNTYTAEAAKLAPQVVDLFQVKGAPEGREITRIIAIADALQARRTFERTAALLTLASIVFAEFARRKGTRAGLDLDDLIAHVVRLLERSHAAEWVLWKLDGGIAHILLDEAQDTSPDQWRILDALTADIFAGAGAERKNPRTMFVVGDQKQSIYSFQGADPEHFLDQQREISRKADEARAPFNKPHLAMSFRSVSEVLAYVDDVFDPSRFGGGAPFSVQVPDEADYAPHTAFRSSEHGCVELWPLEPKPDTNDPDPWDAPVDQQSEASPVVRLARQVAAFVRRELDAGAAVWEKGKQRPAQPGDFLILVKSRVSGLFDAILQQLKILRVPVAGADRILLLDSLAVQDLLNLVRFALCAEDDLILAEILKGPFGAYREGGELSWLDDDDLLELAWDRPGDLWTRVGTSGSPRLAPARAFLADMLASRHLAPFEYLTRAMERSVGLPQPGWELVLSRFGDPAREPVTALIDRAAAFDAEGPPSLEAFVAALEQAGGEIIRELSGPQENVRVMTVHGAKGLQAPIVILPDTTSAPKLEKGGLFFTRTGEPIWVGAKTNDTEETAALRFDSDERALREHRRLLYVALTRAQDRLLVCGAATGSSTAGYDKNSWYALCEQSMQRLVAAGAAATASDTLADTTREIIRIGEAPRRLVAADRDASAGASLPTWLRAPAPAETARRVLSPSGLSRKAEPPVMTPFGPGREERLRRGRLIHLLFEHLPEFPEKERSKAAERFLRRQPGLSPAEQKEMIKAATGVLEDKRFAAVFGPGGRAEAPVIGQIGPDTINGRVDRLVITDAEILVVDYKTDRPAPAAVADVGEAYIAQMAAYRAVLSQRWPDRPIRCLLVWTDGPRLMEIPPSALDRVARPAPA